jgi:hypothetical protein
MSMGVSPSGSMIVKQYLRNGKSLKYDEYFILQKKKKRHRFE